MMPCLTKMILSLYLPAANRTGAFCFPSAMLGALQRVKAKNDKESLIAQGTSTLMVLPDKGLQLGVPKFL